MIVALARKLLIALWHFVRDGVVPEGVILRPAHWREELAQQLLTDSALSARATGRRWRFEVAVSRTYSWLWCRHEEWVRRLGAFAADAHHCIMGWVSAPTEYKDVARMFVHHTRAPLERRHPDHSKCAVVLEAFKDEPSVGANAPILDRFCARRLYSIAWVGAKKRAIKSNKETEGKENG
jgi:hypothetical protein